MILQPLPVKVVLYPNECPWSFAARLAVANGYASLRQFAIHIGTTSSKIFDGDGKAMSSLARLGHVTDAQVARYAVRGEGRATARIGGALVHRRSHNETTHRFCPRCVIEDLDAGTGPRYSRPYVRAQWLVPDIETCKWHAVPLLERAFPLAYAHDFPSFVRTQEPHIRLVAASAVPGAVPAWESYAWERVEGMEDGGFLDGFELYVALDFSRHLGNFLMKRGPYPRAASPFDVGFAVASGGSDAIELALQEAAAHSAKSSPGLNNFFWRLLGWLRQNRDRPEFADLVRIFEDIVLRNFPFGIGSYIVNRVEVRLVHSVTTASNEYGLAPQKIRALLEASGHIENTGLKDAQTWFRVAETRKILQGPGDVLQDRVAATLLGIGEARLKKLREASIISPAGRDGVGGERLTEGEIQAFLSDLFVSVPMAARLEGEVGLARAAVLARCAYVDVIRLVKARKLKSLCRVDENNTLRSLRVDWREVRDLLTKQPLLVHLPATDCLTVGQAATTLGVTRNTVKLLLLADHLAVAEPDLASKGQNKLAIDRGSVITFLERHVSYSSLVDQHGGSTAKTDNALQRLALKPTFVGNTRMNTFFDRERARSLMRQ